MYVYIVFIHKDHERKKNKDQLPNGQTRIYTITMNERRKLGKRCQKSTEIGLIRGKNEQFAFLGKT